MIFPGIGTILNSLGVLTIGILTRIFIKKDFQDFEKNLYPIGLVTLALAIRESLKTESLIIPLVSILIGATIGNFLKIEDKIKSFGKYLHSKYEKSSSDQETFISSFLTTSLIAITGPLALLIIKTVLDCFLVFYITAGGGKGAMYSFIPIMIYQGFFTLLGLVLKNSFLTQVAVENIGSVGGILLLGLAIKILGIKEIPVGNYLPALFLPMFFI